MPRPSKYPLEFRQRSIRVARESERPIAAVARDLGIHRETLRVWVRQDEADDGARSDRLASVEREELTALRREVRDLRRANEVLKGGECAFRPRARPIPSEVSASVDERRGRFGVEPISREIEVPASAYRARKGRQLSRRAVRDAFHVAQIRRLHDASGGAYGSVKIWDDLRDEDLCVARCTVERLMRRSGIVGVGPARTTRTTVPGSAPVAAPDLVRRDFRASRPGAVWLSDFT